MHLTADPLILLVALAFLLPWASIRSSLRRAVYRALAWQLRLRISRSTDTAVLAYVGVMERVDTYRLVQAIRDVPPDRQITLVIDTRGGDASAGFQVMHALAAHDARVAVVVVDECWSAGTIAALGADAILMAPDANLGFCDTVLHSDPSGIHTNPVHIAAKNGEAVEQVRARHTLREHAALIAAARVARGATLDEAELLAERMVMPDSDHWHPIFIEEARKLGLPVEICVHTKRWHKLVHHTGWSR